MSNTVSAIDIRRYSSAYNTVRATIDVGLNPIDALVTPDGGRLVVSNLGDMSLSIIDTDAMSETYHMVLATVGTGQTTRTVAVAARSRSAACSNVGNSSARPMPAAAHAASKHAAMVAGFRVVRTIAVTTNL